MAEPFASKLLTRFVHMVQLRRFRKMRMDVSALNEVRPKWQPSSITINWEQLQLLA